MQIKSVSKQPVIDLALDTLELGKQALVFAESKKSAEKTAEDVARKIKAKSAALDELALGILRALPAPTQQCKRLAICIKKGVAFHHAGLVAKQRELIEGAFRSGAIKIICATPTLAMGLDLPAFRVIMKSLKRYSGAWGMDWIPVLEYLQFAGRAGRPKFQDSHGEAISLAKTDGERDEIHSRYVMGKPEAITSKLAVEPVLRTYVLSLIATGFVRNRKQLADFFSHTFWAHQYSDMERLGRILDKMLVLLEQWEFIHAAGDDEFVSAADIRKEKPIVATLLGRRVAELYIDPYTAHHLIKGLRHAGKQGMTPFAFLQLMSNTLEMRPLLRTKAKEQDEMQTQLLGHYGELLQMEPSVYDPSYDEFIDSIKTTLFFHDWVDEQGEEALLEKYSIRPGEIRGKITIADWLLYAAEELTPLLQLHPLLKELKKLRVRVQYGVREELLTLLRLDGVGRVRARRLYRAGLRDIGDVKKADVALLSRIVGQKTALRIKKQLGQEIVEIPLGKRKGQVSLGKFE